MASSHFSNVKFGRQNGLQAEVTDGLAEGDRVVLHPSDQIEPGVKVVARKSNGVGSADQ